MINVTQKMSKSWSMRKKNKPFLQQTCGDYINDGFIPFSWACSTVSSIVHACSLTWLTGTLKGMEPSSTLLVTPVLFLLWQQECLSTVWAIDLHTHMHTHTYTHTHTSHLCLVVLSYGSCPWIFFRLVWVCDWFFFFGSIWILVFIEEIASITEEHQSENGRNAIPETPSCAINEQLCSFVFPPPSSECGAKGQVDLKNKKGKMF